MLAPYVINSYSPVTNYSCLILRGSCHSQIHKKSAAATKEDCGKSLRIFGFVSLFMSGHKCEFYIRNR